MNATYSTYMIDLGSQKCNISDICRRLCQCDVYKAVYSGISCKIENLTSNRTLMILQRTEVECML